MDLFKKYQFSPDFYLQLFMMSSISNESTFQSVAEAHNSEKHELVVLKESPQAKSNADIPVDNPRNMNQHFICSYFFAKRSLI